MELVNGQYTTSGNVLKDIAKEFGAPVYVYDGNTIVNQYNTLKQAFAPIDMKVKYACKALNNTAILKLLKKQGCGLDTVSINEVLLGLRAGFEPAEVLIYNGKAQLIRKRETMEDLIRNEVEAHI
jgi:diaminopimelate decarboxylase